MSWLSPARVGLDPDCRSPIRNIRRKIRPRVPSRRHPRSFFVGIPRRLLNIESPADDAFGVDADARLGVDDRLAPTADLHAAGAPGVD